MKGISCASVQLQKIDVLAFYMCDVAWTKNWNAEMKSLRGENQTCSTAHDSYASAPRVKDEMF